MKTFMEIGARYPVHAWRLTSKGDYDGGIFVDADPYSIPTIHHILEGANISPEKYEVVCAAISSIDNMLTHFTRCKSFGFLARHSELEVNKNRHVLQDMYVMSITLDHLIQAFLHQPYMLRINVEGAEVEILESYSWEHKPTIIEVDTHIENKEMCGEILTQKC